MQKNNTNIHCELVHFRGPHPQPLSKGEGSDERKNIGKWNKNRIIKFLILGLVISNLVIFLPLSCKKDISTITNVDGVVSEKGSGHPIAGATVLLGRKDLNSYAGYTIQTVQSVITNANGEYKFEFNYEKGFAYTILARKIPYFESESYYPQKGQKNTINISLSSPSYLKIHLKNTSGANSIALGDPCYFDCDYYGTSIDTTTKAFTSHGGETLTFYWVVFNNNVDTLKKSASMFLPPFDTTLFNINY